MMMMGREGEGNNENTLSILIATDNHLGYAEKDVLRTNDSFDAFEEILQIAKNRNVDCVLLGGDLFHENRPSRKTLHKSMELFRHYCMGSKPCAIELLSDPAVNFPSKFGTVNYEDPNYNIAIPVFVIHGNHDDPTGDGNLSSIDLLSTAGLVNYFGKTNTVDDITINPILMRKGNTKLALYGLGAVRDERLHRTFLQRKVKMLRPNNDPDSWFSMMILHQNRVAHGATNYIPEHFLDEFLDFVVWGHEHECQACDPTSCPQRNFTVCQPGSSVATSLSEGETKGKHVVILQVTGKEMKLLPIPLTSVRPFVMRDVILQQVIPKLKVHDTKAISQYLNGQIEEMITMAHNNWNEQHSTDEKPCPLPLIRLRVDYSADLDSEGFATTFAITNPQRFGQQFVNVIANPRDVVYFMRRRILSNRNNSNLKKNDTSTTISSSSDKNRQTEASMRVEDLVGQFLSNTKLDLFPQNEFSDIVRIAVEKDDRDAIESFVKQSIDRPLQSIKTMINGLEKETIKKEFEKLKRLREDEWMRLHPTFESLAIDNMIKRGGEGKRIDNDNEDYNNNNDDDDDDSKGSSDNDKEKENYGNATKLSTRGRGRGRGGRGRGRGRSTTAAGIATTSHTRETSSSTQKSTITTGGNKRQGALEFTAIVSSDPTDIPETQSSATLVKRPTGSSYGWPPRRN